jgi:hypothetical protein
MATLQGAVYTNFLLIELKTNEKASCHGSKASVTAEMEYGDVTSMKTQPSLVTTLHHRTLAEEAV